MITKSEIIAQVYGISKPGVNTLLELRLYGILPFNFSIFEAFERNRGPKKKMIV